MIIFRSNHTKIKFERKLMSETGVISFLIFMIFVAIFKSAYDHVLILDKIIRNMDYDYDDIDHDFNTTQIKI
jgi:hypothetical protein